MKLKQWFYATPFGHRYRQDIAFRTHVSLYVSLGINLAYVGINLLSYALYRSMWFVILAVYYGILAVMRFSLAHYVRRKGFGTDRRGELRRTVFCSAVLLTINFVLSGAVLMILYQNKGFTYHGFLIYGVAAYTFYITVHAIVGLIRYRKHSSPILRMSKTVSVTAALVSMLSLETAMLSAFGQDMAPENKWLFIALTGAGVSATVIVLSVLRIRQSLQEMKNMEKKHGE